MKATTISRRQVLTGVAAVAATAAALGVLPADYRPSIDAMIAPYDIETKRIVYGLVDELLKYMPPQRPYDLETRRIMIEVANDYLKRVAPASTPLTMS